MWHFFSLATSSASGSPPINVWQRSSGRADPIEQMTCWIWTAISLVGASTSTYSQHQLIQDTTLNLYYTTVSTSALCMTIHSSPMNLVHELLATGTWFTNQDELRRPQFCRTGTSNMEQSSCWPSSPRHFSRNIQTFLFAVWLSIQRISCSTRFCAIKMHLIIIIIIGWLVG